MSFLISRMRSHLRAVVLLMLLQLKTPGYKIRWEIPVSQLWKIHAPLYHAPFEYSLKVINPIKMSDFKSFSIHGRRQCRSFADLKDFMEKNIPTGAVEMPNLHDVEIGYIEPGHGIKGRKFWLHTDTDVKEMYAKHRGKKKPCTI